MITILGGLSVWGGVVAVGTVAAGTIAVTLVSAGMATR